MNRHTAANVRPEPGEMFFGVTAPDPRGWLKCDGSYPSMSAELTKKITPRFLWNTQPTGATNVHSKIAFADSTWVVGGGQSSAVRVSTDTINWVNRQTTLGANSVMNTIAFGNGVWLVGGSSGNLHTSTNLVNWNTRTSNFGTGSVLSAVYGNGIWVAVGAGGAIRTSTDNAVTWNTQTSNTAAILYGVAYSTTENVFVASGGGGIGYTLRSSTDGVNWNTQTPNTSGAGFFYDIVHFNGIWMATGNTIRSSTDGAITWNTVNGNGPFGGVSYRAAYGNGIWVMPWGNGNLRTSTDAITWNTASHNFGTSTIRDSAFGNNIFALVGGTGMIQTGNGLGPAVPRVNLNNNIWGWIKQ